MIKEPLEPLEIFEFLIAKTKKKKHYVLFMVGTIGSVYVSGFFETLDGLLCVCTCTSDLTNISSGGAPSVTYSSIDEYYTIMWRATTFPTKEYLMKTHLELFL